MRLRHFEILLTIAHQGSLTAAARVLGITQPAVSQWLADIESALEERLFERGQRLRPLPAAAPVLAYAERALNDAHRAIAEVQAIQAGGRGLVRVGSMQVAAAALLPRAVLRLRQDAPGVDLTLVEDVVTGLWARFERNELDVLITRLDALALRSGYPHRVLFADRHRVVCRVQHPLASRKRLSWRETLRYPWLMPPRDTPLHEAMRATFAASGLVPPEALVTSVAPTANVALLQATDALGLQSGPVAALSLAQRTLVCLPLALTHDIGDVGLVWRDPHPPAPLQTVLQTITQCASDYRPA
jgi:DNA-binding transcriptional LysR family regulator